MKEPQHIAMDNIVKISQAKPITSYFEAVVRRAQPAIYERYDSIVLRFTKNCTNDVFYLCRMLFHLGLVRKEIRKATGPIEIGRGTIIDKMFEVVLVKIPAIQFEDDSDFNEREKSYWDGVLSQ